MKNIIIAALSASFIVVAPAPIASAGPCPGLPFLGNICTPRNPDNPMAPYEGKKGPREAKKSPRSAGAPGS